MTEKETVTAREDQPQLATCPTCGALDKNPPVPALGVRCKDSWHGRAEDQPRPTRETIERAKGFYRRVRNLAVGDELWRCPTNMSRQEVAEFAAWFAQEEGKDSAADDRDFNMIADELGVPRNREAILKAIRALKKK